MLTFVLASSSSTFPKKESYGSEKRREVIVEARARVYNNILEDQAVFSACEAKFKFCRSFCFFWNDISLGKQYPKTVEGTDVEILIFTFLGIFT